MMRLLFLIALSFYPKTFRARYREELVGDFDRHRRDRTRPYGARLRFQTAAISDAVFSAIRMRQYDKPGHRRVTTPAVRSIPAMSNLTRDLKYSVRMLRKNPGFAVAAVLTLAMGIGLNSATFSVVHGILMKPLGGVEEPDELVQLYRHWPGIEFGSNSIPHYQSVRDLSGEAFDAVAAYSFTPMALAADGRSERVMGMLVSANFFQTYGVTPRLGRPFIPGVEDAGPGEHPVAILGHAFWQSRFGADEDVIGRTIGLSGHTFEIVGVAPAEFKGPFNFADNPIYVPIMMQMQVAPGSNNIVARGNNMMNVIGRLREGVSVERAQAVMDQVLAQLLIEFPDSYDNQLGNRLVLQSEAGLHPSFKNAQVGMSAVIMAVVALLLLIACVNVANLFLARARARRRELGIRLSLGAGRGQVVRQLLTESLVFSFLAGAVGLLLAYFVVGALKQVRPPMDGPWDFAIGLDYTVLWFTALVSVVAGLTFGLVPALQSSRPDTMQALKGDEGGRPGGSRVNSTLIVLQMALSLVLLISSGLFLRSLQRATEIDPGFESPGNLVMAAMDPGLQGYDQPRTTDFLDGLVERLETLPEIQAVGFTHVPPLGLSGSDRSVTIPGYEFAEGERSSLDYAVVTEGYLEAMGIRLIEGRTFTAEDDAAAPPVIVVNEHFANRFWPNQSALGKVVTTAGKDREVIGVVATGKYRSLGEAPVDYMYLPQRDVYRTDLTMITRTTANPAVTLGRIRETVRALDADMPLYDVRTMEDHMGVALLPARLGGATLGLFGLLGLVLAAVGIYGVMAYSVARRTREIGIRVALGADRGRVLKLVVGEGLRLAVVGAALGLFAAAAGSRVLSGLLYGVRALDPVAFLGVPTVLLAVATLAVYIPARRAAGVEPTYALKSE